MIALIALAGGLGAVARFVVDGWVHARRPGLGTVVINVTGSFLLGVVIGWLATRDPGWKAILGVGFLGGYTTFSTASVEAARLTLSGRAGAATVHAAGMLIGGLIAAALGLWLGSR